MPRVRYVPYPNDEFQRRFTSVLSVRVDDANSVNPSPSSNNATIRSE